MAPTQPLQKRHLKTLLRKKRGDRPYRLMGLSSAILQVLTNRFVARTTDLYRLIPRRAVKQSDHERQIRHALKTLREYMDPSAPKNDIDRKWGYIRSISWSDPTIENKIEYTCLVHGLTNRGLKLVRDRDLDPDHYGRSFQEFSIDHVDHELRINDLVDALTADATEQGLELIVIRIHLKRKHIHPDFLMYLYDPKTNVRSAPIFVEYEKQKRGKYDDGGNPQVIRKLEALGQYYNSDECETDFGFRKFYVVTILRTERKANFLLKDLADRGMKRKTFLVTSEPAITSNLLSTQLRTPAADTYSLLDL